MRLALSSNEARDGWEGLYHTHSTLCRISASLQLFRTVDGHVCSRNDREGRPNHCSSRLFRNEDWARTCCLEYGPGRSLARNIRVLDLNFQWKSVLPVISASGNLSAKFLGHVSRCSSPSAYRDWCGRTVPRCHSRSQHPALFWVAQAEPGTVDHLM